MIEVRKTLLSPFNENTVRMARQMYRHCPDCGGHTRTMVIRGTQPEGSTSSGPPPAQLFFCDRCALGLLVIYDPTHETAIEQGLPQLLEAAGVLTKDW